MAWWKALLGLPLGCALLAVPYVIYLITQSRTAFYLVCGLIAVVCVVWSTEVAGGVGHSHIMRVGAHDNPAGERASANGHRRADPGRALFIGLIGTPALVLVLTYLVGG